MEIKIKACKLYGVYVFELNRMIWQDLFAWYDKNLPKVAFLSNGHTLLGKNNKNCYWYTLFLQLNWKKCRIKVKSVRKLKRQFFELVILRPFLVILFIANYINIFHKTEVLTVILRCLMSLNLNWIKSYDINYKLFWQLCFSILEEKKASKMAIFWPFVVFFWQLHRYLSQNWDSEGHFEVLSVSKS